jgi:cell division protein FtsX
VVLVLALSLSVPLSVAAVTWMARSWMEPLLGRASDTVVTAVLLRAELDDVEVEQWVAEHARDQPSWRLDRVGDDELKRRLSEWFPTLSRLLAEDRDLVLPRMVEIEVPTGRPPVSFRGDPAVLAVGPGSTLSTQLRRAADRASWLTTAVCVGLLGAAVLMVSVSVHLELYRHAEEVAIMRLVGATEATVRSPFLVASVVPGAIAAVLSMGVTTFLTSQMSAIVEFLGLPPIPLTPAVLLAELAVALLLPVSASFVTLRRHAAFDAAT